MKKIIKIGERELKEKSLAQFIVEHREDIDSFVRAKAYNEIRDSAEREADKIKLDDDRRKRWILSDESLKNWVREEGVKI
jgi:hypothetical protein